MSKYETWLQTAPKAEPIQLWMGFVESQNLTPSERWEEFNNHYNRIHHPHLWQPYPNGQLISFETKTKGKRKKHG